MPAKAGEKAHKTGNFHCDSCGERVQVDQGEEIPRCPNCGNDSYDARTGEPGTKG